MKRKSKNGKQNRRARSFIQGAGNLLKRSYQAYTGKETTPHTQKPTSFLGKLGGIVGKVANVVGQVAPGPIGAMAKVAGNIFNDPDWWQDPLSTGLTTNLPLAMTKVQTTNGRDYYQQRPFLLSINPPQQADVPQVIYTTEDEVSTYLVQEIRKVMNVVPLLSNASYKTAFEGMVALVAIRQTLKRWRWETEHGVPYIPSLASDAAFPLFSASYFASLVASTQLVEETIRARVRLPLTMLEYLAWRFGRVFRSNDSAKAAYVTYDAIPRTISAASLSTVISKVISSISTASAAASDIYNAYYTHEQFMDIDEATQAKYDRKEFVLRTNMDIGANMTQVANDIFTMDSELDNPTVFTASTISTYCGGFFPLFPVSDAIAYMQCATSSPVGWTHVGTGQFYSLSIQSTLASIPDFSIAQTITVDHQKFINMAAACKSLDLYNVGLVIKMGLGAGQFDVTGLSIDSGVVTDQMIATTQQYAFANLVRASRKSRTAEKAAEAKAAVATVIPPLQALVAPTVTDTVSKTAST